MAPQQRVATEAIIGFINDYWRMHGHGPSLGEIAAYCHISRQGAYQRVKRLIRDGVLEWQRHARGTRLVGTLKVKRPYP